MSEGRPGNLNAFQEYVLNRIDQLDDKLGDVQVDVAKLQGRARAWGAVPGAAAVVIALIALFK